jgi:hypothetical protein
MQQLPADQVVPARRSSPGGQQTPDHSPDRCGAGNEHGSEARRSADRCRGGNDR